MLHRIYLVPRRLPHLDPCSTQVLLKGIGSRYNVLIGTYSACERDGFVWGVHMYL